MHVHDGQAYMNHPLCLICYPERLISLPKYHGHADGRCRDDSVLAQLPRTKVAKMAQPDSNAKAAPRVPTRRHRSAPKLGSGRTYSAPARRKGKVAQHTWQPRPAHTQMVVRCQGIDPESLAELHNAAADQQSDQSQQSLEHQ
eukprot:TRINITY_DN6291_c0_g1_i4.p1 TRINITY_DN6291_c0_g1~~TRINITY_DN6291_c0_g1_i4.p1  ORF type:complete len:143 (+),score=17.60 TRINITY_DN6291_c0_g1_i4:544-972(+)